MSYRPRRRSRFRAESLLIPLIVLVFIVIGIYANVIYPYSISAATAKHKIEDSNYTNVQIGSRHVISSEWRCGADYVVAFDFTATTANGHVVHGRVCKGTPPLKGWRVNL